MSQAHEMKALVNRTEALINAISGAILSTTEIACERLELAAQVARVQQRMAAFGAVLEAVGVQKAALAKRLPESTGPMKTLLLKQIALLASQEIAILAKAGVAEPTAAAALAAVDAPTEPTPVPSPTHRRDGRRFLRVAHGTSSDRNGTASDPSGSKEGHNGE